MRFALVIPALNEEEAIAATLRRALASRSKVIAETSVTEMLIVFVNDGSTDRTQEIVDQPEFDPVVRVRFPHNRGYGAAIKAGWRATDAELVGFMDADGTCDPDFSVNLLQRLLDTGADVVLAGRMNPLSKMPRVRRLGNAFFASLLGLLSGRRLTDSASGFRIVRRASLRRITPLPDRLHFTPAMSSICLMNKDLRVEEVPMPYEERIGRSKLSVLRDGLRFLDIMVFTAIFFRPKRFFGTVGAFVAILAGGIALALRWAGHPGPAVSVAAAGVIGLAWAWGTGWSVHSLTHRLSRETTPSPAGGLAGFGLLQRVAQFAAARRRALLQDEYEVDQTDVVHLPDAARAPHLPR
jgi:glycosyltransferase involved in cell wall biosynthesis